MQRASETAEAGTDDYYVVAASGYLSHHRPPQRRSSEFPTSKRRSYHRPHGFAVVDPRAGRRTLVRRRTDTTPAQAAPLHAELVAAYARCRDLNRVHGRSYYLATRLLPAHKRPHVHALYGFTRWADDLVDAVDTSAEERARRLSRWADAFRAGLGGVPVTDPLLPAVLHTIRAYDMDLEDFDRFLASMAMDLSVTAYPTYRDLLAYMEGSAAVVGTMMLPILGLASGGDVGVARESARQLGLAFQLTNIIRDVADDLARGRVYLPAEDLARFGVTGQILAADAAGRRTSEPVRALIEYECRRALGHYVAARPGMAMLEPRSRVCIRAAYLLYGGIIEELRWAGFDVMRGRVRVPPGRRAAMLAAGASEHLFSSWQRRWRIDLPDFG